MKITATLAFTAATAVFFAGAPANACPKNDPACQAARVAAAQAPYKGPLAPSQEPMACVRMVTYGHSEIIWVLGNAQNYVQAPVLYRQGRGAGYSEPFALAPSLQVVESCIPRRLLTNVSELTICNGAVPGKGYHWQMHANSLASLKQTGHVGTYLPLVSGEHRDALPPARVRATYQARY